MAFNILDKSKSAESSNMSSVQERLQLKREPIDKWSLREQICLASAVARSGDQNWISVSRALKPFGEPNRPLDWFHQKNCAAQYGALLGNVETPKRKKRAGMENLGETPVECILKKLLAERQVELKNVLAEEKAEYKKIQDDMKLLQTGRVSEEQLDKWCKEIDEEEARREQEAQNHSKWLKQRDLRKQEIERSWRPIRPYFTVVGQKRKMPDVVDDFIDHERDVNSQVQRDSTSQYQQYVTATTSQQQHVQNPPPQYPPQLIPTHEMQHQSQQQTNHVQHQESTKPALSPLLTSLLKSPSQVQNISSVPNSILHSAITSQNISKPVESSCNSNPTISNLLGISTNTPVPSNMEEFPTLAINQQDTNNITNNDDSSHPLDADILDDANLKIDDLAKSILVQDGPFPEIKKEEVDDIISEIIENAQDIVADPDQHLELDGNGDININLEFDDLDQEITNDEPPKKEIIVEDVKTDTKSPVVPPPVIDPFEFQEDPVLFESPVKPSSLKQDNAQYVPLYQQSPIKPEESNKSTGETNQVSFSPSTSSTKEVDKNHYSKSVHGSVEIVEVVAEEHENEKELNNAQIRDIVHSNKEKDDKLEVESHSEIFSQTNDAETSNHESDVKTESLPESEEDTKTVPSGFEVKVNEEEDKSDNKKFILSSSQSENVSDYADDLYDNINMEVKIDKTGKTKRDYSRTKKKEEKSFDILLAIEKAHLDDMNLSDEVEHPKKEVHVRVKSENERSISPWTEEEDGHSKPGRRRYSTCGTPIDSMPNSPASSIMYYDDDKDYRNWKKSVMLVYNRLASNKYASLFLKPITDEQAPGYSSVIYRPMDLQTIKKNIDNGIIRTSLEFKRAVMLMFTNAIMYNKTNGTIYNMALQMQQESMDPIGILLQAEGQVDAPLRRETRTSESHCKRKRIPDEPFKIKKRKDE